MTKFANMELPGFDPDRLVTAQRRYLEAWTNATQIMADAMQTVVRRQTELTEAALREFWAEGETMLRAAPGEYRPEEQFARMQGFYERASANVRELSDILLSAQREAMSVLGDGAAASLAPFKQDAA